MLPFETSFYYGLLCFLLGIPSLFFFGKLSRRIKFLGCIWILWTIFSIMIPGSLILLYYLSPIPLSSIYFILWQLTAFSSVTSLSLFFYVLILLDPDVHGWLKVGYFWSILWVSIILINIYDPDTVTSLDLGAFFLRLPLYGLGLFFLSYIPIIQVGIRYLRKQRTHIRKYKDPLGHLFIWGFILLLLAYPVSFSLSGIISWPIFGALFLGILSIGSICVGFALTRNQRFLISIPNMVIELSVFHKSGVKLLSLQLRSDYQPTELKQGVIIGLQGLLTDLLGNDIVQEIKLKDRHVLLMYNQRLGYIVVLATLQIHKIMKIFLQEFARAFEDHFQTELQQCIDINNPVDPAKFKPFETQTRELFAI